MSLKYAFLFPGQGSQGVGMGEDFFNNSDKAKEMFAEAKKATGIDFEELLFTENDKLGETAYTQPAIMLVGAIAHKLFTDECGVVPDVMMGHSLGEFTALVGSGALSLADGIKLVNMRGQYMADACAKQPVGMLVSLGLDDESVEGICAQQRDNGKQVWPVNYNSDGQIVIAGIKSDLEELVSVLKESGAKRAMLLDMSVASHCPLLQEASDRLSPLLEELIVDSFVAPVISNVTGHAYSTKQEALKLLPQQLVKPVLYKQSIASIDADVDVYIEFGHGNVLKGLNRKATKKPHFNVSNMESLRATIEAIKEL